jgi:prophage antirepressor-like protein
MNDFFKTLEQNYVLFENKVIGIVIDKYEQIWFNAKDLATALGYSNQKKAIKTHTEKTDRMQIMNINTKKIKIHPHSVFLTESGMYKLILKSNLPNAKVFNKWITDEVLPSIRKFGYYKIQKKTEQKVTKLLNKINYLEKENENMKNELKKDNYPDGALVYAIDYSDEENEIYRIGMTNDMKKRKQIYDTHHLYKRKVVITKECICPIKVEYCIRGMLYEYRYKNKKDFYVCNFAKINKAFKVCDKSIECMNQIGGCFEDSKIKMKNEVIKMKSEINKLKKIIHEK